MRARTLLAIAAGIVCGNATLTTPAGASGFPAYLSRTGSGGSCSLASPCASMASALAVAGPGGEVICLDKGDYGPASITFAVTISCGDGLWEAPFSTITINAPAGADIVIEGVTSDALAGTGTGTIVIIFGGGTVHLRHVRLGNRAGNSGGTSIGIGYTPTSPAKLFVTDSYIYNIGGSGISAAILLKPTSTANVTIERTRIENSRFGIVADGSDGGIISGVVRDSTIVGSANNAITVSATGSNVVLGVDGCTISGNNFGLVAAGSNTGMLVGRSIIGSNNTGLVTAAGGVLLSYRDNRLNANTSDGAFTGPVGLQ